MSVTQGAVNVGLVGFGMAGRVFHAPVISAVPGLRLSAILQRTGDEAARAYPDARVVRSLDHLLDLDDVTLVVVATPTPSHADLARRCLEAGRHVVVDKPFAPTSAEAASLVDLSERTGRLLSVFHNRRWDGDFLTVQRLLGRGACGRPLLFEVHFDRYRPQRKPQAWRERPQPGSGILFDLGSHLADQAMTLFGPPDAVTADVRRERDGAATDDGFDVMLHYPDKRALLRSSMLACDNGLRMVLRGTEGTYVKHGIDPQEERLARGERPAGPDWGREAAEHWGQLTRATDAGLVRERVETEAGDYRRYYENVRDAAGGRAALAVTAPQARDVIRLLEMALESSRLGRTIAWPRAS